MKAITNARRAGLLAALLLAGAAPSALAQQVVQLPLAETDTTVAQRVDGMEDFVDGVIESGLMNREIAGAVFVMVANGEVVFQKGYGYADVDTGTPVDPERTLFRPGSVSKLFTWTALMQLVEQGKVHLDDDINQYLDFEIPDTFPQKIRVRDLLDHSPGFEDGYADMFSTSPDQYVPLGPWLASHVPARVRPPGVEISYSNYGSAIAGYIVERVSGESFFDYMDNHIFGPLGMAHSTFREPLPDGWDANAAKGYDFKDGRFVAKPPELIHNIAPAGAVSATGADMARFMIAHLQDGRYGDARILRADTAREMRQRLLANAPGLPGLAHGFLEGRISNPRVVWHAGNTADFHSNLVLIPEQNVGFYVSMTGGEGSSTARSELTALVLERLIPTERLPAWTGATGDVVEGTYRTNRRSYTSHRVMPSSLIQLSRDGEHRLKMTMAGETVYWEQVGPRVYQQVGTVTTPYGPVGLLQFYGEGADTRFSFEEQPYTLYRLEP